MKHTLSEVKLKNGAKGLIIHVPNSTVMTFDLNFRAGDFLCDPSKWETAHLMEHVVLGANKKYRSAQKFQSVLELNGADSNASTGSYNINYEAECADFEWDRILDLLVVAVGQPLFLQKEYDAEVGNVNEELMYRSNNTASVLALELKKRCGFVGYTYKDGMKSMANITLSDVRAHHAQTHYGRNLRFIIAGNTKDRKKDIIKKLENLGIPEGDSGRIDLPKELAHGLDKPVYIANKSVKNIHFALDTYHNKAFTQPEVDAVSTIDDILCGGYVSKIYGKARERGLTYALNSGIYTTRCTTGWGIEGQVSVENVAPLFELITREARHLLAGNLDIGDLRRAKQQAIGRYQRGTQTVGGLANGYARKFFWDDTVEPYDAIPERIKAITRQRALDSFASLFADGTWSLGLLGSIPKDKQEELYKISSRIWS